jgi:two-component system alkaline phosphatase synthesis response regulator PhoP
MAKILVVDDERDVVELLKFLLSKDGNIVEGVSDGKQALEKIGLLPSAGEIFSPDLVVLDVMMPVIDGYTVQRRMWGNTASKDIPILILTAKGHMKDLFGASSNVVSYIEKPFDPEILRAKIRDILKKRNI